MGALAKVRLHFRRICNSIRAVFPSSGVSQRHRSLLVEPLEPRSLLATISATMAPVWSQDPERTFPAYYNGSGGSSVLSFFGASWDVRYFGLPSFSVPGWFRLREGGCNFKITPEQGEKIGDEVKITLFASINAVSDHSENPNFGYHDYTVFAPHDDKRIDAVVGGPSGTFLNAHFSHGFGIVRKSGFQTFTARIGDTVPLTIDFSGDGYYFNHTEGRLAISARFGDATDLSVESQSEDFVWNNVEDGGGFTFTYNVTSSSSQRLPDTAIDFNWARGSGASDVLPTYTAYRFDLNDEGPGPGVQIRAGSNDLKASGKHTVHVSHSALVSQLAIGGDPSPPQIDSNQRATYLRMVIDPQNTVQEIDEENNSRAIKVIPLVVNVVTHGFQIFPESVQSWDTFREPFRQLGKQIENAPVENSILDGRVKSYVLPWDSHTSFAKGFTFLSLSMIEDAQADILQRTGTGNSIGVTLHRAIAQALRNEAARSTASSDQLLLRAAITTSEAITVAGGLLESPDIANQFQHIHLIGHSRGAGLNAQLARLLVDKGYKNIEYTALDGYDADWPAASGILSRVDISDETAVLGEWRYNYRADVGLVQILTNLFPDWVSSIAAELLPELIARYSGSNELRAPIRSGFASNAELPDAAHFKFTYEGVTQAYTGLREYLNTRLGPCFVSMVGGDCIRKRPLAQSIVSRVMSITADSISRPHAPDTISFGFVDGDLSQLAALANSVANLPLSGISPVDGAIAELKDPTKLVPRVWDTAGNVAFQPNDGGSLELRFSQVGQTSVGQTIALPGGPSVLEFTVKARDVGSPQWYGHALSVTQDELYFPAFVALHELSSEGKRVKVPFDAAEGVTRFDFKILGAYKSDTVVTLDDISIRSANSAPELQFRDATFPIVANTPLPNSDRGISVGELVKSSHDADANALRGIAIVDSRTDVGALEYSLNNGQTWLDVGNTSEQEACTGSA